MIEKSLVARPPGEPPNGFQAPWPLPDRPRSAAGTLGAFACLVMLAICCRPATAANDTWLVFDGKDDVVTSASIKLVNSITVEAWVRATTIPNTRAQSRIISKNAPFELMISTGDTGCHFGTAGHVQWRAKIGGEDRRLCGGILQPAVWHHLAGTYNGSRFRLYVDGSLVADVARTGTLATNSKQIVLGNRPLRDRGLHGDLDDVRIWSRALSESEIRSYMDTPPAATDSGLQAWYRLDDGSGQSALDSSPWLRHAFLGSSSATDTADPLWQSAAGTGNDAPTGTPTLTSLLVTPSVVSISPGATPQFSAEGFDASGEPVAITPVWSATGGSVNQAGRYAAGSVTGQYSVTATADGVNGQATIIISTVTVAWPTGGWIAETPSQLGMTASALNQARDYALTGGGSGYITRHGKLALSWGDPKLLYDLKSSAKSLGSTTLGIAIGDGLVRIDDLAQAHLPTVGLPPDVNAVTGWLDDIRILHLGTHTSGFAKPGGYEAIQFLPGTKWQYSDGGANWLADLLTVRFGNDLRAVLFSRALTPIGVTSADLKWRNNAYRDDTINGIKSREFGSGIRANVDAMARIGYLYLRRGNWNGRQLLPESYIDLVSRPHPRTIGRPVVDTSKYGAASSHYGVLWWTNADGTLAGVPTDAYWSWGLGDSLVIVIPSLDMVVARAGNGWRTGWNPDYAVLKPFLGPIAESVSGP